MLIFINIERFFSLGTKKPFFSSNVLRCKTRDEILPLDAIFKLNNLNKFTKEVKGIKISSKRKISSLVLHLKKLLEKKSFFVPTEKKHSMLMNINNLIYRLEPNDKELRILASIISSLSKKNINHN